VLAVMMSRAKQIQVEGAGRPAALPAPAMIDFKARRTSDVFLTLCRTAALY
jgi:hypothetical protein